jgi:hypothetical protein
MLSLQQKQMLARTPKESPSVLEIEGKGWAELESKGIPF